MSDQTPYTPSEAFMRRAYAFMSDTFDDANGLPRHGDDEKCAEFDRFIAKVKRDAWEEGAQHGSRSPGYYPDENPYGYDEDVTP